MQTSIMTMTCVRCEKAFEAQYLVKPFTTERDADRFLVLGGGACEDCRPVILRELEESEAAAKLLAIAAKRREWRENCGIEPKFMNQDFSTFAPDAQLAQYRKSAAKALTRCRVYADGYPMVFHPRGYGSLVLMGHGAEGYGIGKTHLACAIAHRILDRWQGQEDVYRPVKVLVEDSMFSEIQASYRANGPPEELLMARLVHSGLLIVDDVGTRQTQNIEFRQRIWFSLLDGRYRVERPIVLTTNLDPAGLRDWIGVRPFDRLLEMCGGKFLEMQGQSYRRKGAEK